MRPHLTKVRYHYMMALRDNKVLLSRPFVPRELIALRLGRGGKPFPASGATMDSLAKAGWVRKVVVGDDGYLPFRSGGPAVAWEVTDEGRRVMDMLPDKFPGEPTYGGNQMTLKEELRAALKGEQP